MLGARADVLGEDARLVDADCQGPTGIDLVFTNEAGRPIVLDIVNDDPRLVPGRIFEHLEWLERNRRLFLRAYSGDGVVNAESPLFVFVAGSWPKGVVRAVSGIRGAEVRLYRAEHFLVDGSGELLLEEVSTPGAAGPSPGVARRSEELNGGGTGDVERRIEIESVRTLFALFRSGVDGLDGRISEDRRDGGLVFTLGDTVLAGVTVSPGSFTVSPGDPVANPVVVSDRVSLERALNAVVSLFVRERQSAAVEPATGARLPVDIGDDERAELDRIWGDGVGAGEGR